MNRGECGFKSGELMPCAPLALAYVPMQQSVTPGYEADTAIIRGTLFPGLDLPFKNIVNKMPLDDTPMSELMALDFVLDELELYLNTHKDDKEAFAMYQTFLRLAAEGRKKYVSLYGPISQTDMMGMQNYKWVNNPWPWEYMERAGD
jgi:spore coat protein JB